MSALGIYVSAALAGLLGGAHCLAMCGGLVGTLTVGLDPAVRSDPWRMLPFQLGYNLGRVGSYTLAGAAAGGLGAGLLALDSLQTAQRALYALAGTAMVLLGLYLGDWWHVLGRIERLGTALWVRIRPLAARWLPIRRVGQAVAVGAVWAWVPCGLVYSTLILAVAAGGPTEGALVMLAFGLGTLPNLLGIAMLAGAAARIAERHWVRRVAGLLAIGLGLHAWWQLVG